MRTLWEKSKLLAVLILISGFAHGDEPREPRLRAEGEWMMIVATMKNSAGAEVPWTICFRKQAILSVCIEANFDEIDALTSKDGPSSKMQAEGDDARLPAIVKITTSELVGPGDNKSYKVHGFTFESAGVFLESILEQLNAAPE